MKTRFPSEAIDFYCLDKFNPRLDRWERSMLKEIIHSEAVAEVKSHYAKYAYR